jgi:cytoskeletal protein RodZ
MQLFVAALMIKLGATGSLGDAESNNLGILLIFVLFAGPITVAIHSVCHKASSDETFDDDMSEDLKDTSASFHKVGRRSTTQLAKRTNNKGAKGSRMSRLSAQRSMEMPPLLRSSSHSPSTDAQATRGDRFTTEPPSEEKFDSSAAAEDASATVTDGDDGGGDANKTPLAPRAPPSPKKKSAQSSASAERVKQARSRAFVDDSGKPMGTSLG